MRNPGLSAFAAVMAPARPSTHPIWGDINDDVDPDRRIDPDEDDSDFVRGEGFGRWRTPGQSLRVPVRQGPVFAPGQTPEDVIHGEVVSPAEQDGADRIIHGEHDSDQPSDNPFVEHARRDLHTPSATSAVSTLSDLLSGRHPDDVGGIDEAHDYLSQHFTGVRVNPDRGTLLAASPTGTQLVRRRVHLPAVREEPTEPTYSLTNRHGIFESSDPQRLVRAMVAFEIIHNAVAMEQKRDDDEDRGLSSTSGLFRSRRRPSRDWPSGAIFEPGHGTDTNHSGQLGGYVMEDHSAPPDWHRDGNGIAYSPGHSMGEMLHPTKSKIPRDDPYFLGHKFTYAPNHAEGYTIERHGGGITYFVNKLHPAARGPGFDLPKSPLRRPTLDDGMGDPDRLPELGRAPFFDDGYDDDDDGGHGSLPTWHRTGSVRVNDLCPVCASGYLEPYDQERHECLNCGSLVSHVGFERTAARPKGGLGRGLKQIVDPGASAVGMGLNEDGSVKSDPPVVDLDETMARHPLAEEELPEEYEGYEAPRNILDKQAGEADPIEEFMGKAGYFPIHKPGEERVYVAHLPGALPAYARLTEGAGGKGWVLTADHTPMREQWFGPEGLYRKRDIALDPILPGARKPRYPLTDPANRTMAEKSILAAGHHPIDDDALNRAIRDVAANGRNSETYQRAVLDTAYEPPRSPTPGLGSTQRELRQLSSVGNPGLARFMRGDGVTNWEMTISPRSTRQLAD